ncbi:unnamed protein product [Allacma fusca]|uniref:Uncharacterized protein n=1 Tax=Allacma fusca TaxID=39272 RepID=A0A8J2KDH4_9HEXA|nr:unnamed protein product [Allacma fusca]
MNENVEMFEESDFEEPSQTEEAMEVLQVKNPEFIIDYENTGKNIETNEDKDKVNEACLRLPTAIAMYDEQQPLFALQFIIGPNNEVNSNQTTVVSDQTKIQYDSRPLLVPPVLMDYELSGTSGHLAGS